MLVHDGDFRLFTAYTFCGVMRFFVFLTQFFYIRPIQRTVTLMIDFVLTSFFQFMNCLALNFQLFLRDFNLGVSSTFIAMVIFGCFWGIFRVVGDLFICTVLESELSSYRN